MIVNYDIYYYTIILKLGIMHNKFAILCKNNGRK